MTTRRGRARRRPLAALLLTAATTLLLSSTVQPIPSPPDNHGAGVWAAWTATASQSGTVTMASLGDLFAFVTGSGVTTPTSFTVTSTSTTATTRGAATLTNTSTIPARTTLEWTRSTAALAVVVDECSAQWTSATTCSGTTTRIIDSRTNNAMSGTYTWNTSTPVNGVKHLRVSMAGARGNAVLTATNTPARAATDRTAA